MENVPVKGFLKVLVVDENNAMREKIAGLMSRIEGIDAVSQLSDGGKLEDYMKQSAPRIILIDMGVAYREQNRLAAIRRANPDISIIVLIEKGEELFTHTGIGERIGVSRVLPKKDVFSGIQEFLQENCS